MLRARTATYEVDDHGNVLKETLATEGGVRRDVVSSYEIREGDWLVGLLQRREVTSSASAATAQEVNALTPRRVVEYVHDSRGLLTQVDFEPDHAGTDLAETISLARSPDDGLPVTMTRQAAGQPGRVTSIDFGDAERVFPVRVWNGLDHTYWFAHHPAYGTLGNVMDPNGVQTERVYDDVGRLRSVTPDGGAMVTLVYEPSSLGVPSAYVVGTRVKVSDEAGREEIAEYDAWDRPVLEMRHGFDGTWIHQETAYDALGNLFEQTRPGFGAPASARTAYRYDSLGRLLEVGLPGGAAITHAHTFLETRTWDAAKNESYVVRDVDDRLVKRVEVLSAGELTTSYEIGAFDLLAEVIDPRPQCR